MTSALSARDAYHIAKAALKIGQAFTKGRKSAPAEFREVESQLYALSAALNALAKAREAEGASPLLADPAQSSQQVPRNLDANQDVVLVMINTCKETIGHLEKIVEQYSVLAPGSNPDKSRIKRWKQEVNVDWKKITWTTEGGDLNALKSTLAVQTNSLNLILGVVNNTQANRLQTDVGHITTMMTDIHEWFVKNLRDATESHFAAGPAPARSFTGISVVGEASAVPSTVELVFELHEQTGNQNNLICPRACLSQKVSGAYYSSSLKTNQLFSCECSTTGGAPSHRQVVESYGLSPLSFATRIAGSERSWLLFKVANKVTDQLTTLVVKGVPPEAMFDFEEMLVHGLSVIQTKQMMRRRMNTMLAHTSDADAECPKANLLDIVSNATTVQTSVTSVKFASSGAQYLRDSVDFVQMLHYKSISLERLMDDTILPQSAFNEQKQAEIVIMYKKREASDSGDDIVRTTLHLKWNSETELKTNDDVVVLRNVDCTGYDRNERPSPTTLAVVTFDFAGRGAAMQFHKEVEALRMELFIIYLQYPRDDEKIFLKLQAENVDTERMRINDAEITILQNAKTHRFRLVVQSRNGYSILSQELADDFFQKMTAQGRPDYRTLSFEVYMDATGKRLVRKCPDGFSFLMFSDSRIDQVFAIGLAAVGGPQEQQRLPEASQPMEDVVQG